MSDKELSDLKKELAKLAVVKGLNFPKGSYVEIYGSPKHEDLVSYVVEEAYKLGARRVIVHWMSSSIGNLRYIYEEENDLINPLAYETMQKEFAHKNNNPRINIVSEEFINLNGVNIDKFNRVRTAIALQNLKYDEARKNACPWNVIPAMNLTWAKKIVKNQKDKSEDEILKEGWKLLFNACRISKNKSIINWDEHIRTLKEKSMYLNSLHIKYLHYKSSNGTDLVIGLNKDAFFVGGCASCATTKRLFLPNIPTEEIFTYPNKYEVNGVVYSTRPLIFNGQVIDDFSFVFKDGKIVEVHAKKNEKLLKQLVNTDGGSCYLGEAALVPCDSPISKTIFYSTLFDENASCHLAFGQAIPFSVKNFDKKTSKEIDDIGFNKSSTHIDFMIGDKNLNITAKLYNGKEVKIFRNGTWAK